MAIATLTSRTVITKLVGTGQVVNSVLTDVTITTVPAGKRTRVTGKIWCVDLGAASSARVTANAIIIARWDTGGGVLHDRRPDQVGGASMALNVIYNIDVILEAGETLVLTQNSGTNAQFKRILKIEELPA